ncbi:methyltransferase domain-containing protein [Streptomyces sp. NPDC021098]|uniref:methyltransferase domain-containing protein n=1 Tax=unclassified Streptomyces TaxID=2593676 RepID=UPI00379AC76E
MSETSVTHFYDELTDDYHLIYADWDVSVHRQGQVLDSLTGQEHAAVLDCSCGIGTQAIGLAQHGHRATGTDLSRRALARAAGEAAASPPGRRPLRHRGTNGHLPALALARRRRALRHGALPAPPGRRRMASPGPPNHLLGPRPGPAGRPCVRGRVRGPHMAAAAGDRLLPPLLVARG